MNERSFFRPKTTITLACLAFQCSHAMANANPVVTLRSPDDQVHAQVFLNPDGSPGYRILRADQPVLLDSKLGVIREDDNFSVGLTWLEPSTPGKIVDTYELPGSKKLVNHYEANRQVFHLLSAKGGRLDIAFQVSNDGVAFRYAFPETQAKPHRIREEVTSFRFDPSTRAWLQPIAEAKTSWGKCNPSYEEYYECNIPVGKKPTTGVGWVYPALYRPANSSDTWVLISESGLDAHYCATRLRADSPNGEYQIGFPDPRETAFEGLVTPQSTLPWASPWRVIALGSLATIMESTLGTDVAPAPAVPYRIEPGKASWSWPLLKDEKTTFDVQKSFVDYAANMGWRYCLVDAVWDVQIGYQKMRDLCQYAATKGVKIIVWYNSAGDWNETPQTPKNMMLTRESRLKEFQRIKEIGIAGLKIDFFGGDGQSMIAYYLDILKDAESFGFLINFHGCTLPRGWQRTYPHLVTMEAIRGLEFITFEQPWADKAPEHMTMLPFARNVFDPMDFTPMVLDQIPNIKRHTSSTFELATAVLYVSGVQHYAEIPDGMAKMPEFVQNFVRSIPSVWDEVRFLDGHPGEFLVMARRAGNHWFLAGISSSKTEKVLNLDLTRLGNLAAGEIITDTNDTTANRFSKTECKPDSKGKLAITLHPNSGFVATLKATSH